MANNSNSDFQGEEEIQTVGFRCDQCDKVFKHKKDLTRHQKAKHSDVTYPCGTCGKGFQYVGDKTRHEETCNIGSKAYGCNICGKQCATEGGLGRHQDTHQGSSKPQKASTQRPKEGTKEEDKGARSWSVE